MAKAIPEFVRDNVRERIKALREEIRGLEDYLATGKPANGTKTVKAKSKTLSPEHKAKIAEGQKKAAAKKKAEEPAATSEAVGETVSLVGLKG